METIGEYGVPKIAVVIPYRKGSRKLAEKAAKIHHSRAGMPCKVFFVEDKFKDYWVAIQNRMFRKLDCDYYVYSCDDYFPGKGYLKMAYDVACKYQKGMVAFNDGKWNGIIGTAALVSRKFIEDIAIYNGNLFHEGYKMSYGDPELTEIAMEREEYIYCPDAVLMEIDYEKESKPHTNEEDRATYKKRDVTKVKRFG